MEDILASIRKILNEDETATVSDATVASTAPYSLTADMLEDDAPAEEVPPLAAAPMDDVTPMAEAAVPAPVMPAAPDPVVAAAPVPEPAPAPDLSALVAPAVAAAAAASLGSLVRAVAAERHATVHRGGPSIEDVVREELRPLLKTWLDTHLPPLVERLVRLEIERVVGRSLP
ncbi:DUF2497 domain-containing protein [Humitalea sp. 24SJ18S-53]|uniref:DUF2497 domain-containing protein n=1 Tax=Humitalea sp. 24SJ18S-53 TaxID=3422307 RepID=UPI003D66DFF6